MSAFKEIWTAILSWRIWSTIAIEDVIGRYRRTLLGPLWIVISQCAFIFGIYLVRQAFTNGDSENYLLYLTISIPLWNLIASFMLESSTALLRSKGYIESYPLPLATFILRSTASSVVNFFHVLIVFFAVAIFYGHSLTVASLLFIPALLILCILGFGLGLCLAPLGARFRDVGAAVASSIGLLFVLTPIFWMPTPDQLESPIIKFNPFYYLLEMARQPLLSGTIDPQVWVVSIALTIVCVIAGVTIYKITRPTIVYWL